MLIQRDVRQTGSKQGVDLLYCKSNLILAGRIDEHRGLLTNEYFGKMIEDSILNFMLLEDHLALVIMNPRDLTSRFYLGF